MRSHLYLHPLKGIRCVIKSPVLRPNSSIMVTLTEKELIGKLKELRQITPRKDWAVLTKTRILAQEPEYRRRASVSFFPFLKPKPAFAGFIALFMVVGGFYVAVKNSLPGESLYAIRRIAHQGEAFFVSEQEKPVFQLKLANDRLEDLTKVSARNLAPTLDEFQANISQAAKELVKMDAATSTPLAIKKIIEETKKLEENKQKAESLGVVIDGTEELDNILQAIVGNLIEDLEQRSLTEDKEEVLSQMKELFGAEKYSQALELYLINQ